MRAVVLRVAPGWRPGACATILLTTTSLGVSDVRAAFDEIDERYHVEGVDICVEEGGGHVRVTLSRAGAYAFGELRLRVDLVAQVGLNAHDAWHPPRPRGSGPAAREMAGPEVVEVVGRCRRKALQRQRGTVTLAA
jgi:hypothetical protein